MFKNFLKSIYSKKQFSSLVYDLKAIENYRDSSSFYKDTVYQKLVYDLNLKNLLNSMFLITKQFDTLVFLGPNPESFLINKPSKKSHKIISDLRKNSKRIQIPENIFGLKINHEKWPFQDNSIDCIVNNLYLHSVNSTEEIFIKYNESLKPDGCFIGNTYAMNSFRELKAVLNLAESEREGGISPNAIPLKEMSDLGNLLSRTGYNLTTLNLTKFNLHFRDLSQIFDFIKSIGESNFLINRRRMKSRETFIAASALYKSLYNKKNYESSDHRIVKIDLYKYLNDDLIYTETNETIEDYLILTLEVANMIGWKYHPNQQKPKKRGSGEINLKDLSNDLLHDNPEEEIKFGRIELKKGLLQDEEDYEIIDETERIKEVIKSKFGEERLQEKLRSLQVDKENKDKDE